MVHAFQRLGLLMAALGSLGLQPQAMSQALDFGHSSPLPVANRGLLSQFYTPPKLPGESNHYFDMWPGPGLRNLALAAGLTNNHALLINSHGKAIQTPSGLQYVYYPHAACLETNASEVAFSASDLAAVLGPAVRDIHNIIVGGCNEEGAFNAIELRRYFQNATNIVHAPAGQPGYQPMFFAAFFNYSAQIRPLYQNVRPGKAGTCEYEIDYAPGQASTALSPYLAELFEPGATSPFRTQVAGRELLVSNPNQLTASYPIGSSIASHHR